MATVLQAYSGVGDQEAVELTVDPKRWQWVLGCLGAEEPAFSQGALFDFRMRLLSTGMDQQLLERTVELARGRGGVDAKTLRLALDSSPLWGRGRVEDTLNLLGHAAHPVIGGLAALAQDVEIVVRDKPSNHPQAHISVVVATRADHSGPFKSPAP